MQLIREECLIYNLTFSMHALLCFHDNPQQRILPVFTFDRFSMPDAFFFFSLSLHLGISVFSLALVCIGVLQRCAYFQCNRYVTETVPSTFSLTVVYHGLSSYAFLIIPSIVSQSFSTVVGSSGFGGSYGYMSQY